MNFLYQATNNLANLLDPDGEHDGEASPRFSLSFSSLCMTTMLISLSGDTYYRIIV